MNISFADIVILHSTLDSKPMPRNIKYLDRLQDIASKNNIQITFKPMPWKRALLLIEKGLADGLINASYQSKRALYARYPMKENRVDGSKRLNDGKTYYIYKNRNSTLKWDGEKFINPDGAVGAMQKYAVIEDLEKHENIAIQTMNEKVSLIRAVARKKLAAYAGMANEVDFVLKKYPIFAQQIVRESMPIRKKDYFLIFSKKTYQHKSQDMESIWNGLKKFNESKVRNSD